MACLPTTFLAEKGVTPRRRLDSLIAQALLVGRDPILGDFLLGLIQRDVTGTDMRVQEVLKLIFDVRVPIGALVWLWPQVRLLV